MLLSFLLKGIAIGFSIAAPVGPIGILCIQRTLARGKIAGLFTGLGTATADTLYGAIAAYGLSAAAKQWPPTMQFIFHLAGAFFLLYLGVKTFRSKPPEQTAPVEARGAISDFISALFLTLTNPTTILSFAAVFVAFGLGETPDQFFATVMVAGVFLGSALWWVVLSSAVSFFRSKMEMAAIQIMNKVFSLILFGFGVLILAKLQTFRP